MCTVDGYWTAIRLLGFIRERDGSDGQSVIFRDANGDIVRVQRPESMVTDEERSAMIDFYAQFHAPIQN